MHGHGTATGARWRGARTHARGHGARTSHDRPRGVANRHTLTCVGRISYGRSVVDAGDRLTRDTDPHVTGTHSRSAVYFMPRNSMSRATSSGIGSLSDSSTMVGGGSMLLVRSAATYFANSVETAQPVVGGMESVLQSKFMAPVLALAVYQFFLVLPRRPSLRSDHAAPAVVNSSTIGAWCRVRPAYTNVGLSPQVPHSTYTPLHSSSPAPLTTTRRNLRPPACWGLELNANSKNPSMWPRMMLIVRRAALSRRAWDPSFRFVMIQLRGRARGKQRTTARYSHFRSVYAPVRAHSPTTYTHAPPSASPTPYPVVPLPCDDTFASRHGTPRRGPCMPEPPRLA